MDDALYVQGTTQEPPPLYLNSTARPMGYTVLDAHETQKVIPPEDYNFLPLLREERLQWLLPKHPSTDHEINLKPDFQPLFVLLERLSQADLKAPKEWLDNHLKREFIQPLSSLAASSMLFLRKKEGSLRPCIDYWKLNQGTIQD
jgi:hypothetical protein